jgi:hypothetical protein
MINEEEKSEGSEEDEADENEDAGDIEDEDEDEEAGEIAAEIAAQHISDRTRLNYAYKIRAVLAWLREKHPACVEDDEITIHLPLELVVLTEFFGFISYRHPQERRGIYSYSTVTGYFSAIKNLYRERGMVIPAAHVHSVNQFLQGFKRTVARARDEGNIALVSDVTDIVNISSLMLLTCVNCFVALERRKGTAFI